MATLISIATYLLINGTSHHILFSAVSEKLQIVLVSSEDECMSLEMKSPQLWMFRQVECWALLLLATEEPMIDL